MQFESPNRRDWSLRSQQALVVTAVVLVIGSLHLAKSAFVPLLFAAFLAMLLAPAASMVQRAGVPRAVAAGVVLLSLIAVAGLGFNATWRPAKAWLDQAPQTMRTLERKLRPVTGFIAKVESVSEQAERVTDPGAARNAAAAPATATETRKSTIANTQEWLLAILTTLVVTYFLLAAGPSLLVKTEASGGARRINMRLVRLAAAISDDLSRYGTGLRRGGAHRTRRGGAQRAADSVLRERVGGRGYGPIERTRRLTAAACCRIERDRGQRAARGRPGLTSAGSRDRYAPAQLRRRSARARRRGPLPSSSPRTRSAEPRPSVSRR